MGSSGIARNDSHSGCSGSLDFVQVLLYPYYHLC